MKTKYSISSIRGNSWSDYDPRTTQRQVSSVFRKNARRDNKEPVQGGNPEAAAVPERMKTDFEPELCVIGDMRIKCYF